MSLKKYGSLSFLLLGCLFALFLSACGAQVPQIQQTSALASQSLLVNSINLSPQISTACPAAGKGRAAVLPHLSLGSHQNVVYTYNTFNNKGNPLSSTLKRYDVVTKTKTVIYAVQQKFIAGVQISADGQWVLFVAQQTVQGAQLSKLQLIRMDGTHLQTLYCAPSINETQWSTDQKLIVFSTISNGTESVDVLHATTGAVQTDLSVPAKNGVNVRTWLDTKRIYITNTQIDQPPNTIYLLDTSKGANQQLSNLPVVFHGAFADFDSSYGGSKLFINSCVCGYGDTGPSTITVRPATGGQGQTLFAAPAYAVTSMRAVTPTTLLFIIDNFSIAGQANQSHNGLWKINTNGTHITRLTTDAPGSSSGFNSATQFPWSNVSRDNSTYALQTNTSQKETLELGSLSGGAPTTIAYISGNGASLSFVGWTTM
jgi:eukaryotic-like serine/threonine-protein kinase